MAENSELAILIYQTTAELADNIGCLTQELSEVRNHDKERELELVYQINSDLMFGDAFIDNSIDKANPKFLDYLNALSGFSDDDYNNSVKLVEALSKVSKKHLLAKQQGKKRSNNKSNTLRGKYGKGNVSKP